MGGEIRKRRGMQAVLELGLLQLRLRVTVYIWSRGDLSRE